MTEKKRKFMMLTTDGSYFPELLTSGTHRPGSYQWHNAFRKMGWDISILHVKDSSRPDIIASDIIYINACGVTIDLIRDVKATIKNSDSHAKLIINLDYPLSTYEPAFPDPIVFLKALFCADFIFTQEPSQQALIQYIIDHVQYPGMTNPFLGKGLKVPLVPHPSDTSMKEWLVPYEQRLPILSVVHHRYPPAHFYVPAWLTSDLLIRNEDGTVEPVMSFVHGVADQIAPTFLFDYVGGRGAGNWERFIYLLAYSRWALDYYEVYSQDRYCCECAMLKVPMACTNHSYFGKILWPYTCHDLIDIQGMRESVERLVSDRKFYDQCADYAFQKVEEYSLENSYARLVKAMNEWGIKIDE